MNKLLSKIVVALVRRGEYALAEDLSDVMARQPMDVERTREREAEEEMETLRNQLPEMTDPVRIREATQRIQELKTKFKIDVSRPNKITPSGGISRPTTVSK